jgi:hypothetical protein
MLYLSLTHLQVDQQGQEAKQILVAQKFHWVHLVLFQQVCLT